MGEAQAVAGVAIMGSNRSVRAGHQLETTIFGRRVVQSDPNGNFVTAFSVRPVLVKRRAEFGIGVLKDDFIA